jgi:hypothetical protein
MKEHEMKRMTVVLVLSLMLLPLHSFAQYKIHDMSRPHPAVIDPGFASVADKAGLAPSDAIVLFNGVDLSQWCSMDGSPAKWKVDKGCMETVRGTGMIRTIQNFGDCQLHVEWAAPLPAEGSSQGRGNSGVFLMGLYEVQVLDSYQNETYADGQASAIYGEFPPLVNACRKPGEWQTYDIIFHRPIFDGKGGLVKPAVITVLHNGVLVHDQVEIKGPTTWLTNLPYVEHADQLPLALQDHSNPVRFRNIWTRPLPTPASYVRTITLPESLMDRYVGKYQVNPGMTVVVTRDGDRFIISMHGQHKEEMFASSETDFFLKKVDIQVKYDIEQGIVKGMTVFQGGGTMPAKKIKE